MIEALITVFVNFFVTLIVCGTVQYLAEKRVDKEWAELVRGLVAAVNSFDKPVKITDLKFKGIDLMSKG